MSYLLVAVPIIYLDIRGDIRDDNVDHTTVTVAWSTLSPRMHCGCWRVMRLYRRSSSHHRRVVHAVPPHPQDFPHVSTFCTMSPLVESRYMRRIVYSRKRRGSCVCIVTARGCACGMTMCQMHRRPARTLTTASVVRVYRASVEVSSALC